MEKTINLEEMYNKLKMIEQTMVTKKELDSTIESFMIYSNENTMKQINKSEKDIKDGRVKKISSTKDI